MIAIGADDLRAAPGEVTCPVCGSPFVPHPNGTVFCSKTCYAKKQSLSSIDENLELLRRIEPRRQWRDTSDLRKRMCVWCGDIFDSAHHSFGGAFCCDEHSNTYWHKRKNIHRRGLQTANLIAVHTKNYGDQIELLKGERDALEEQIETLKSDRRDAYLEAVKDAGYRHRNETKRALTKMAQELDVLRKYSLLPTAQLEKVRERLGDLTLACLDGAVKAFQGPTVLENGEVVENSWTPAQAKTFEAILAKVVPDANAVLTTARGMAETGRKQSALDAKVHGLSESDQDRLEGMSQDELSALLNGKIIEAEE